ncbi:MAG: heliorhodopsin HeR [Micrococcales bacterium]
MQRLRAYNLVAGFAHLAQAAGMLLIMVALEAQPEFPVTADYMAGPPGSPIPPERVQLFTVNMGYGLVGFLGLSALFHFLISSPVFFERYKSGLLKNHNYFRWVEYSLSSSIMIFLIAQLTGVTDINALMSIFAVNSAMILFGALQEKYESPGTGKLLPFIFGSMVGIVPWFSIFLMVIQPKSTNDAEVPGFVIGIMVSIFIAFNTFALNQWLQYKQVGKWKSYLQGERTYITLSLVAKTLLAWQVFSGVLAPLLAGN